MTSAPFAALPYSGYQHTVELLATKKLTKWLNFEHSQSNQMSKFHTKRKALTKQRQELDAYHSLNPPEHVMMVRLRSGHNRLNAHLNKKYRLVQLPICPCGEEDQTAEHVLQRCKRHDQERAATWPPETTLQQKLYGNVEDLRRTTSFIVDTGVVV
jgi:hypothetical protein